MADVRPVAVGDIYRGVSGNRMEVIDLDGGWCLLQYDPNPGHEEPWWEESDGVARYLDLVRAAPSDARGGPDA